jgi:Sortilin, neurotensin receptor 3,
MLSKLMLFVFSILIVMTLFSCNDNGVSPQQDAGDTTWVRCEGLPDLPFSGICASGNNIIAGVPMTLLSSVYIYYSSNNGLNWGKVEISVNNHTPGNHLYLVPSTTFLIYGTNIYLGVGDVNKGAILISKDQGLSWNSVVKNWSNTDTTAGPEDINDFVVVNRSIFAGTNHGVFRSSDYGANWNSVNIGLSYDDYDSIYHHAPQVEQLASLGTNIFAGTTVGEGTYISTNSGDSWSDLQNAPTANMGLTVINSRIFAAVYGSGIYFSDNLGDSWIKADSGMTTNKIIMLTTIGSSLYAGTNTGIFLSTNEGANWADISAGTSVDSLDVGGIAVNSYYIFVSTSHGVWRYPLSRLPTSVSNERNPLLQK